jgi:hypothetical protein
MDCNVEHVKGAYGVNLANRVYLSLIVPFFFTMCSSLYAATIDSSCYGPIIKQNVPCPGEQVDPGAAINSPASYIWSIFAEINQPAFQNDSNDKRRVWETWKSADDNHNPNDAIYLDNGHAPQAWNVGPQKVVPSKQLVPIQQLQMLRIQGNDAKGNFTPFLIPTDPLSEEVRTNRPAFNFILQHQLYNLQGQYQFASVHPGFDFPTPSKEVKAVWIEATGGINPSDYYSATVNGKTYVLVAMHVITKDIPFWLWATFVHKDRNKDPSNGYVAPLADDQTIPASLKGTPFENYRLIGENVQTANGKLIPNGNGAQIDWIVRTGEATVMGNPHIESGFENKSSCITCHAHSSIALQNDGKIVTNGFPLKVGAVDPKDFQVNGNIFFPLDFLWSLRKAKDFEP